MPQTLESAPRSQVTLVLCTLLHMFTHAYGAMLVPLYLLITRDLHLGKVQFAALLVTVYGVVYMACSFGSGMLADRLDRRWLLGCGLVINAIAVVLMGLTRRYELLIALAVLGGLAGTLFHPAANAMIPAHFPKSPGMVIGLLGIGSGLGFFFGPQYAGWRAVHASWHFGSIANWQRPCIELGLMGLICGLLFLLIAREAPGATHARKEPRPLGRRMRWVVTAIACTLGCRDFSGVASVSLVSIYLQKAHHLDAAAAGFVVGSMMLIGVVANPVAVWISPGAKRLPMLVFSLVCAGIIAFTIPGVSRAWVLAVLCLYQGFHLGSYSISDAAILERVPAALRGRVVGLFLSLAGTAASTSPWIMGLWTDHFGPHASDPHAYYAPFGLLGILMFAATLSVPLIAQLGEPVLGAIEPIRQIAPATMEPVL